MSIPVVVSGKVNGKKVIMEQSYWDAEIKGAVLGEATISVNNKTQQDTMIVYITTADGPVK